MGLIGGLAGGAMAFGRALARYLPDEAKERRIWLVQIGAGALAMCLGWLIFTIVMPGDVRIWQTLLAGLVVGALLAAGSTAPVAWPDPLRLALSLAVGVLAFVLIGASALIYNAVFWWLFIMGLAAGAGFFWGMNPDEKS